MALVPIIDVLRGGASRRVVSDACIGCDGETMTVRVFSQVPPDRVRTLWVDSHSHTSVALARVLWRILHDRDLELRVLEADMGGLDQHEAVLLIGDKVVDPRRGSFAYEVDLGGAWRQHTGLPFVFAVWAEKVGVGSSEGGCDVGALLCAARDRGVTRASEIAELHGPRAGWPVESARRYLTRCLVYKLDERAIEGADLFARLCGEAGLVPAGARVAWPGREVGAQQ